MIRSSLAVLLMGTVMLSCSKKKDDPSPGGNPKPNSGTSRPEFLEEGTEYVYKYSSFFDDSVDVLSKIVKEVAKDTFEVRNYTEASSYPGKLFMAWNNGSLYSSVRLRDKAGYQKLCDFGAAVGTTWTGKYGTYTIEAHNTQVTTSMGVVTDVTKVKYLSNGSISYAYYSPKYGIVGQGYESKGSMGATIIDLKSVKKGIKNPSPSVKIPAITYGNFPFLKVGVQHKYHITSNFDEEEDSLTLNVTRKLSNANIYEVTMTFKESGVVNTAYWYEDAGLLMIYEAGETPAQADVVFESSAVAQVGNAWVGLSGTTTFFYKISDIDYDYSSDLYPNVKATAIQVGNGMFSSQTNYWSENIGQLEISELSQNVLLVSTKGLKTAHVSHPVTLYGGL